MASTVEMEIITPEKVLYRGDVEMVLVRAVDGDRGYHAWPSSPHNRPADWPD